MAKLNYHYSILYTPLHTFDFTRYNNIVSLETYEKLIMPKVNRLISNLRHNPTSRQEVIVVNQEQNDNSCLLTLQFQIENDTLILIANYRSQCELAGRPVDTLMNLYIATLFVNCLQLENAKIFVNVGNYHTNLDYDPTQDILLLNNHKKRPLDTSRYSNFFRNITLICNLIF